MALGFCLSVCFVGGGSWCVLIFIDFVCIAMCVCVSVCTRIEKGIRFPGAGVTKL